MQHPPSIYQKIETILKNSNKPLTCNDIFEKDEIRAEVQSSDEISDRLGYLWRRGRVVRVPSPQLGVKSARFAYSLRKTANKPETPVSIDDVKPGMRYKGFDVTKNPDGSIVLYTDGLEITVRRRT